MLTRKSLPLSVLSLENQPSANAWRVVEMLEKVERDQAGDPDPVGWTPAYRHYLARKIDREYRGY
jgi:hypothetical protein